MVVGYNMFSFDLFGLGRKGTGSKHVEKENTVQQQKAEEPEPVTEKDDDPERDLFFWALYPVF